MKSDGVTKVGSLKLTLPRGLKISNAKIKGWQGVQVQLARLLSELWDLNPDDMVVEFSAQHTVIEDWEEAKDIFDYFNIDSDPTGKKLIAKLSNGVNFETRVTGWSVARGFCLELSVEPVLMREYHVISFHIMLPLKFDGPAQDDGAHYWYIKTAEGSTSSEWKTGALVLVEDFLLAKEH